MRNGIGRESPLQVIIRQLHQAVIPLERSWAGWLGLQTERLSRGGKGMFLALFILFAGGWSLCLVVGAFGGKRAFSYPSEQVKRAAVSGTSNERPGIGLLISQEEYGRIHRFTLYMDSLKATASGKRLFDSIILRRRGLMDSLRLVEDLYQLQTKQR